jgi:hypothetical protein
MVKCEMQIASSRIVLWDSYTLCLESHFHMYISCIHWILFFVKLHSWFNTWVFMFTILRLLWTLSVEQIIFIGNVQTSINSLSYLAPLLSFSNNLSCTNPFMKGTTNAKEVLLSSNYMCCYLTTLLHAVYQRIDMCCSIPLQRHVRQRILNPLV